MRNIWIDLLKRPFLLHLKNLLLHCCWFNYCSHFGVGFLILFLLKVVECVRMLILTSNVNGFSIISQQNFTKYIYKEHPFYDFQITTRKRKRGGISTAVN
jgi:hypothetical protein